jgi:hypothetical protein
MRLPFEFAEPVTPTRVRPWPHPGAEVDLRRRDPLRTGASARRSIHARRRAAEWP